MIPIFILVFAALPAPIVSTLNKLNLSPLIVCDWINGVVASCASNANDWLPNTLIDAVVFESNATLWVLKKPKCGLKEKMLG